MVEPKRVLHVSCGIKKDTKLYQMFRNPDWIEIRLDVDPRVEPDIVGSIVEMSTVETASFDAVWSSHNLEHLESHEVPRALKEFRRVLKPSGFLMITLPDLQSVAELVAKDQLLEPAYESPAGPIAPLDMIFGHRPSIAAGKAHVNDLERIGYSCVVRIARHSGRSRQMATRSAMSSVSHMARRCPWRGGVSTPRRYRGHCLCDSLPNAYQRHKQQRSSCELPTVIAP